ncbi:uncharacterized protein N7496_004588, partial [Penicillium cataractarum]
GDQELAAVEKEFMDLMKTGNLAPLVDRIQKPGILPSSFPTLEEAEHGRQHLAKLIFDNYNQLKDIMQHYENFITHSWNAKNKKSRDNVLLKAWPGMNQKHNMAFEDILQEKRPNEQSCKWPHINLEDLNQKGTLLAFLTSRVQASPSAYYFMDREALNLGERAGVIRMPILSEYGMMFTGKDSAQDYGEIFNFHNPAGAWLVKTKRGLFVHHGLMTMEAQARIYQFLVDCCLAILPDNRNDWDKANAAAELKLAKSIKKPGPQWVETRIAERIALAPYSRPGYLDIDQLVDLIQARKSLADYEVRLLRESPKYFASKLAEYAEHRPEQTLASEKQEPQSLNDLKPSSKLKTPEFWDSVIRSLLRDAFYGVVFWHEICESLEALQALLRQHQAGIDLKKDLPKVLEESFTNLWLKLDHFMAKVTSYLAIRVQTCPRIRKKFFNPPKDEKIRPRENGGIEDPSFDDCRTLLRLLVYRGNIPTLQQRITTTVIADELERHMENNPKEAKMISGFMMQRVSDMSLLASCFTQICNFHPWAATFEPNAREKQKQDEDPLQETRALKKKFKRSLEGEPLDQLGKFFYASASSTIWPGGNPTQKYTQQRQASERELDNFWLKVDSLLQPVVDQVPNNARGPLRPPPAGSLERTPDWVEEEPAPSKTKRGWDTTDLAKDVEPGPLAKKPKTKTHGVADPSRAALEGGPGQQAAPEPLKIKVNEEDFEVFTVLFHIPGHVPRRELSWVRFKQAMGRLNFEIHKDGGSAWHFTPPANLGTRSISFHAPHPDNTHPLAIWRRIGWRLGNKYGWDGSTFELEG